MLYRLISRTSLFVILWWLLTEGDHSNWWLGGILAILATSLSIKLVPLRSWSMGGLLRFIPFFIERSLKSCLDVAWRALSPGLNIDPILIKYPLRLPKGFPRVFMADMVSLLPGTLSAELDNFSLSVHVLDGKKDYRLELSQLEQHIAQMVGVSLQSRRDGIATTQSGHL